MHSRTLCKLCSTPSENDISSIDLRNTKGVRQPHNKEKKEEGKKNGIVIESKHGIRRLRPEGFIIIINAVFHGTNLKRQRARRVDGLRVL